MIEVKDIVKSFDGNVVLNHVSTEMRDGEVNMIIGQSGSGKTVLMKSMIGLHALDSGQILYDGRDIAEMRSKDIRMLHRELSHLKLRDLKVRCSSEDDLFRYHQLHCHQHYS